MKQENFFILLELPFDPPTEDEAQIRAAIHAKQQEWYRLQSSPDHFSAALKHIEQIPIIEEAMLDPERRAIEARLARVIHEEMQSSFEAELRVLEGRGYLLPSEVRELYNKYRSYGFTIEEIYDLAKVPITDTPLKTISAPPTGKALSRSTASLLETNLDIIGKEDLYEFLNLTQPATPHQLLANARVIHHNTFHAEEKSGALVAAQVLADLSLKIFENDQTKSAYDTYLSVSTYPRLNEIIQSENEKSSYISPDVLMRLVNFGVTTYGASVLELEEYIRAYCEAYDITVNIDSPQVTCPNCQHQSPKGTLFCPACAAPLEGNCPECNTFFTGGAAVCSRCSFPVGKMGKAIPYVESAKTAIIDSDWSTAQRDIEYIEKFWPTHPQLETLRPQADSLRKVYDEFIVAIDEAVKEHRFYLASQLKDKAENMGIPVPHETKTHVSDTIRDFEKRLAVLKNRETIGFDSLNELATQVADSLELGRMLALYPPEPPTRFTARPAESGVNLAWNKSPSTGLIRYIVARKENSVPLTAYDGAIIYEGEGNSFLDESIPQLRNFFYSVFTKRGSSYSSMGTVATASVCIIPELQNFLVTPADGAAQLSWDLPQNVKEIKLWRKEGDTAPDGPGDGLELTTSRLDGYTDVNLKNHQTYWYYSVVVYQTPEGTTKESRGMAQSVTPHSFKSAIDHYSIIQADDAEHYFLNWEGAPNEEVIFFSSNVKPHFTLGKMVPVDNLISSYTRLQADQQRPNQVRIRLKVVGGLYVFPAVVAGRFASVGKLEYITNVESVEHVSYDLIDGDVFINFKWPMGQQVKSVRIAWRNDGFPENADQKGTKTIDCTREQYDYDAGVRISEVKTGTYYFKIYSVFVTPEGGELISEGIELKLDNTPAKEFYYTVKYNKPLLSSRYKVSVTVESEHIFHLPRALLVGKEGSVPLSISDGTSLFEIEKEQGVAGSITYEYSSDKLPKNMYVRLFFFDDSVYTQLRPIPGRSLRLTRP